MVFTPTAEQKIVEKIRKVLTADTDLNTYVKKRVYGAYISLIHEPVYPAVSLHILSGGAQSSLDTLIAVNIQVDLWFPSDKFTVEDVMLAYGKIRALLHRQKLTDTALSLTALNSLETSSGPVMYEDDTSLYHFPAVYNFLAL